MSKKSINQAYQPMSVNVPQPKNISDLVDQPLLLISYETVEGKDGMYYQLTLQHRDTSQMYIVGTRATVVVKQLQAMPPIPEPPILLTFGTLGKMYTIVPFNDEEPQSETSNDFYEEPKL